MVKENLSEAMITEKFSSREIRQEDIVQVMSQQSIKFIEGRYSQIINMGIKTRKDWY